MSSGVNPLFSRGGFGLGCLPLHEIFRVEIVVLDENHPWGVELVNPFAKDLEDISGFLDDG